MFRIMRHTNTLGKQVGDTYIRFVPKNSKYTKYADIDANTHNYNIVNNAKKTFMV